MARPPRNYVAGYPAHVVQRGVNRAPVFFEEADRALYLRVLARGAERYGVDVHAYVLMDNHVHLLGTPRTCEAFSDLMRYLGGQFAPRLNERVGRTGHLWEGRHFSAVITEPRYFFAYMRYVEMNPVRAGIVRHPGAFPWSSHRANALGAPRGVVCEHPCQLATGATPAERRKAHADLFAPHVLAAIDVEREAERFRRSLRRSRTRTPVGLECSPPDWTSASVHGESR